MGNFDHVPVSKPALDSALRALASAIVSRNKRRLTASSDMPEDFDLRLAPTATDMSKNRRPILSYDVTNYMSVAAFSKALGHLSEGYGAEVTYEASGAPTYVHVCGRTCAWAYDLLGVERPSPFRFLEEQMLQEALEELDEGGWCAEWARRRLDGVRKSKAACSNPTSHAEELKDMLALMRVYDKGARPIWKRALSVQALGDSKLLEKTYQKRLIRAAESVGAIEPRANETESLEALGISSNPSARRVGGCGMFTFDDGYALDLSEHGGYGLALSSELISRIVSVQGVRLVLIIENETNFHVTASKRDDGALCIYGQGANLDSTLFGLLDALDRLLPEDVRFLAWSDIDSGGFDIVCGIMERCERVEPFLMGVEDLRAFPPDRLLKHANSPYWKAHMAPKLEDARYERFWGVIRACVSDKRTLEQEIMLNGYSERAIARVLAGEDRTNHEEPCPVREDGGPSPAGALREPVPGAG